MKKINTLISIVFCLLLFSCKNKSVLNDIETFKAPNQITETYDYNLKNNKPLPNNFSDVLVYDIWLTITNKMESRGIAKNNLPKDIIMQAINIYKNSDWKELIGLRPYTNSSFIKSLKEDELDILADNILVHIKQNGIWEKPKAETNIDIISVDTMPSN